MKLTYVISSYCGMFNIENEDVASTVRIQGLSKELLYIKGYDEIRLRCILIILHYFKYIQIYITESTDVETI